MVKTLVSVDHVADGLNNLLGQYKNATLLKGFIEPFLNELNDIETDLTAFKNQLPLFGATGENLDRWGDILNGNRRPTDDNTYRAYLYTLVAAYNSQGSGQNIRSLILSVLNALEVIIYDYGQARFAVEAINPVYTFDRLLLPEIISFAKPAGVEFLGYTEVNAFDGSYFAFEGDANPLAGTYSVIVSTITYYDYIFAGTGLANTARIINEGDFSGTVYLRFNSAKNDGSNFTQQLTDYANTEDAYLSIVDSAGVTWEMISSGNMGRQIISGPDWQGNILFWYQGGSTTYKTLKKNGIETNETDFLNNFGFYLDTDQATYNANNPNGMLSSPEGFDVVGGGYYSLLLT